MSAPPAVDPARRGADAPVEGVSGWRAAVRQAVTVPIRLYRLTGPIRQPRCRFHPSCSTYALEAIRLHGALRGSVLAVRRLLRCHPWNPGGVDHVPPRSSR